MQHPRACLRGIWVIRCPEIFCQICDIQVHDNVLNRFDPLNGRSIGAFEKAK